MNIKNQFHQKYKILSKNGIPCNLGIGSYGMVQLANNIQTNELFAIKKIFNKISKKQVEIHSKLKHSNIIKLIQAFFDQEKNCTILVLEYANNGSLYDFQKSSNFKDKQLTLKVFKGVCQGIAYLHRNAIIHRDIKPENILLDQDYNPKICDFGSAFRGISSSQVCGTSLYMAPQIILHQEYNRKVDVWSLGILLYQMIQGHLPYKTVQQKKLIESLEKPLQFNTNSAQNFKEIIEQILIVNPQNRPQIKQILNEKFSKLDQKIEFHEKQYNQSTRISTSQEQFDKQQQDKDLIRLYKQVSMQYNSSTSCFKPQKQNAISLKQYKKNKRVESEVSLNIKIKYKNHVNQQNNKSQSSIWERNSIKRQGNQKISLKRRHPRHILE